MQTAHHVEQRTMRLNATKRRSWHYSVPSSSRTGTCGSDMTLRPGYPARERSHFKAAWSTGVGPPDRRGNRLARHANAEDTHRTDGAALWSVGAVPTGRRLGFLSDNGRANMSADTRAQGMLAGPEAHQHTRLQPIEQRHDRELRQLLQTRLRGAHGPAWCTAVLAQLPAAFEHFNEAHPTRR